MTKLIKCFGKYSKDDIYCKECDIAIECSKPPIKPCNCLECDLHEVDFIPEEDTYHSCNHPSAIGMFLTPWDNNHFPDWCPRGYKCEC